MRIFVAASAALLATTSSADISRTDQSMRVLFEDVGPSGNYVELSFGRVSPEANTPGIDNPLGDYTQAGFSYLHRFNEQFSVALIYDQPFGASVEYPAASIFNGGNATVETDAATIVGRYEFGNGFSAHAGIRALSAEGSILTGVNGQFANLTGDSDLGFGGLVGVAYERPDIALRVALTYHSSIDVEFTATETVILPPGAPTTQVFDVEFPESINLEFQTGIAQNTLLFGSVRHQFWDGFNLTVPGSATGSAAQYVNFTSDTTTYTIGIGRRLNENWSGSISYTHRTDGTIPSDTALSPTTGLDTITLAGQYEFDNMSISGGITYGMPGDQTVIGPGPTTVNFTDNEVFGIGLRVGFRF